MSAEQSNPFQYQRLIVAYHGCDRKVRDHILLGKTKLKPSEKAYDWLGHGIYFWEHGMDRAMKWAEARVGGDIKEPAVLGAYLHLGHCFDLMDTRYTEVLSQTWGPFVESLKSEGKPVPRNLPGFAGDPDRVKRLRDCAMLNWTLRRTEESLQQSFDTVRGAFQEGNVAFPESMIFKESHIQISVRNPDCILGVFLPNIE